ncbi:MAG: DUF3048 domain-containing protein, partial [Patescibacteria group bacterium]
MKGATRFLFFGIGLALAVTAGFFVFLWQRPDFFALTSESQKIFPGPFPIATKFDGILPQESGQLTLPPLGVMLENEIMARPWQKGLAKADIVYEAPTEGGITRFLAIFFPGNYPEKMGPIRSARSYYLDWAREYNAVYAHVGGHEDVLARLMREPVYNADQFLYDAYFRRENVGKTALEHTMFSTGEKMEKLIRDKKWTWNVPVYASEKTEFSKITLASFPPAQNIAINFGYPTYNVSYQYDPVANRYLRFLAKKPHMDHLHEEQIAPAIVVIQKLKSWSNGDIAGTISMQTIGEGEAAVFEGGRMIEARWKKDSLTGPTKFFDTKNGGEIPFPNSPIWIEALGST